MAIPDRTTSAWGQGLRILCWYAEDSTHCFNLLEIKSHASITFHIEGNADNFALSKSEKGTFDWKYLIISYVELTAMFWVNY